MQRMVLGKIYLKGLFYNTSHMPPPLSLANLWGHYGIRAMSLAQIAEGSITSGDLLHV